MARAVGRPTLQDVADAADVSRTTASFVLNNRDDMRIGQAATERVRRAARELGYRPNQAARALSTRSSASIGLLSDGVTTDGFAVPLLEGCLAEAAAHDHTLLITEWAGDQAARDTGLEDFADRQVDGIVMVTNFASTVELPPLPPRTPVVTINACDPAAQVATILPDDRDGARSLVEHLLDAADRPAGGAAPALWVVGELPEDLLGAAERRAGIDRALAARGVALAQHLPCRWWPESAFEATRSALLAHGRPDAVLCLNDRVAMGVYQALQEAGLTIPDDVRIAAFDDSPIAAWLRPALTTSRLPHAEMGRRAIRLLLGDGPPEPGVLRLPMPLQVRESTRR